MPKLPNNKFFDINKLPKEYGILVFPISLSRVQTAQSPKEIIAFLNHFSPSKVSDSKIGVNVVYGDYLYLHSSEPAEKLRNSFAQLVIDHKNGTRRLIRKHRDAFQIQHAFSFQVWNDQYLRYDGDFYMDFIAFKKWAIKDKKMMKYIKEDCEHWGFPMSEEQINFYLEEHLMFYFLSKGKSQIPNDYVQDREKWILWCYPGTQPKALVYTYQRNFFDLDNPKNIYQNSAYDLEVKKVIDFTRIDLATYNYKYEN